MFMRAWLISVALSVVTLPSLAADPAVEPDDGVTVFRNYGYDFGYVDYDTLSLRGGDLIEGHYSPSLVAACGLSSPRTTVPRNELGLRYTVRCPGSSKRVYYMTAGPTGPHSYIKLERGIPADCGAFANLDIGNSHPSRPIRVWITWQRPSDGQLLHYGPYTVAAGSTRQSVLRCGFGSSWLKDASY